MSHELRTPLNVILLLSQQLAENQPGNLTAQQVEFARIVQASGADLLHLIDDVLDLAKIESGTINVVVEEVSLARVRDSILRHFGPLAAAKQLALRVQLAGDLPRSWDSDAQRVRQILKNLLTNAIKFTARGHIEVRVGFATEGWRPGHPVLRHAAQVIAFAVEDTGIGVPATQQQLIFESFQQADATISRHHGGTGLGLAISRELAALLGGAITLASVPGQGSTFTLYLPMKFVGPELSGITAEMAPRAEVAERKIIIAARARRAPISEEPTGDPAESAGARPGARPAGGAHANLRGRKVLLVDDDARNIFALTALLEDHELATLSATNGRTAIELLQTTPDVQLVLMDIMMPEMDGYETMRELRQSPRFRTLPILALTAHAMPGDREKCLAAGASDYLTKPVNSQQLLTVMSEWLAR